MELKSSNSFPAQMIHMKIGIRTKMTKLFAIGETTTCSILCPKHPVLPKCKKKTKKTQKKLLSLFT